MIFEPTNVTKLQPLIMWLKKRKSGVEGLKEIIFRANTGSKQILKWCPFLFFHFQINPRLPEYGALRRLPGQHVLQQVPPVEVAGEVKSVTWHVTSQQNGSHLHRQHVSKGTWWEQIITNNCEQSGTHKASGREWQIRHASSSWFYCFFSFIVVLCEKSSINYFNSFASCDPVTPNPAVEVITALDQQDTPHLSQPKAADVMVLTSPLYDRRCF